MRKRKPETRVPNPESVIRASSLGLASSPLHVLLIHQIYMSPGEAGGTRHHELGGHLIERGHHVTIIASSVSYLTGKTVRKDGRVSSPEFRELGTRNSELGTPSVIRTWAYSGVQRSFFGRLLSFFSFMFSSFVAAMRVRNVDLIWGTSPPIFQGFTAWLVARLKRIPFVFEVRDLWPDFAVQTGVLRNPLLIWASRRLERFLYAHADHLIVNSPGFLPHLRNCGIPERRIDLVPNGVEVTHFRPEDRGESVRRDFGLAGRFVVLYTGALGLANDLGTLIEAAGRLRNQPQILLALLGDGKERARLKAQVESLDLRNITFIPAQPKSRIPDFLAAADVCVALLKPVPMFDTTYPNKVFDYMAAGRPTVLGIDGVIRQVIEQAQGGTFVPPGNADALAKTILNYYRSPCLCSFQGRSARSYVETHFDRRPQALKLERVLKATYAARRLPLDASRAFKRVLDLALVLPGLVIASPLLLLSWILVRLDLGAPVLFRQQRPGRHGRPFTICKFRTMNQVESPKLKVESPGQSGFQPSAFNSSGFPPDAERLTRVGRFLRAASLDELPTLFNVLKGDMSLVGPRPLLPEYLGRYTPEQARRHEVKPGITGWAQVNGRNALSWDDKLAMDVWYVDHQSIALDLMILFRTLLKVLRREGITAPGHATAPAFQGGNRTQ